MPVSAATLRVLVVDDEALIRWSLVEALTERGHAVFEAEDAAGAIRAVTEEPEPPHVILLDYRLPDSADLDLLAIIRRRVPDAQVIMMTAYSTPELIAGAFQLGVYRVVTKPFEVADLADLVARAHQARQS